MNRTIKILIPFLTFAILLLFISAVNTIVVKGTNNDIEERYQNLLRNDVASGNLSSIDYDYIKSDLEDVSEIIEDILSDDLDIKKKTEYYKIAENVYDNKINEIIAILNYNLGDDDFESLQNEIDEFRNNLIKSSSEIKTNIKSTGDFEYYINKYIYEEKQKKCNELLEEYKEFLIK